MTASFVCVGLDHRHIYGMTAHLIAAGARCLGFWTDGTPNTLPGFAKRFPNLKRFDTFTSAVDCGADFAVIAAPPDKRAELSEETMRNGMDVMVDKPGCITLKELAQLRSTVTETGRIWSIDFSERFEVPAVTLATQLVTQGEIGRVVHTTGLGPHRLNIDSRPDWFSERARYGGILADIASHQIDQFLHFTGVSDAEVVDAHVDNHANPSHPELQDFGELTLRGTGASGYIRVDWFTPDALPTWGDGRLTILGTQGYIELRKYVDVGGQSGTDHLIVANGKRCDRIDASGAGLPYFPAFLKDIRQRTETAMSQAHCFKVMELALKAQALAEET